MRWLGIVVTLSLLLALTACATGTQMQGLREGTPKADVITALGRPDGFQRHGDYEALTYTNRLISGWAWDRADYTVILHNDRVVEFGPGEVRRRSSGVNTLFIVPLASR